MDYLHQATDTAPVTTFSDKPCRVNGVTYQPKWAWSDEYRRCFRKTYGKAKTQAHKETRGYQRAQQIGPS